ncbi:MAG: hypothetical protein ACPLPT_07335 [Moorellales bacterium]
MSENSRNVWSNPGVAGILGLCCVVIPLCCMNLGWLPPQGAPVLLGWLIFGGIVQIVAGIIELRRGGGILLGTPLIVFGFMLCVTPAFGEMVKIWANAPAAPAAANGVGFMVVAAYVISLFVAVGTISGLLLFLCVLLDIGLWLAGLTFLGVIGGALSAVGWIALLVFALGMLYMACGIYLAEVFGRPVLPIGKPIFAPKQ